MTALTCVMCSQLVLAGAVENIERGRNLLSDPGFEVGGVWQSVGAGFELDSGVAHSGARSMRCSGSTTEANAGARQAIELDPPILHPVRISGWSRAERAEVAQDYSIYIDAFHVDGTPLWGQIASFDYGTHGWQRTEYTFTPLKPLSRIECFILFRKAAGTVWFDDIRVELAPFELAYAQVIPGLYGPGSFEAVAITSLPATWRAEVRTAGGVSEVASGEAVPARVAWAADDTESAPTALRIEATDTLLGETIAREYPIEQPAQTRRTDYVAWVESSMERVMPQRLPSGPLPSLGTDIALAAHEYESFQIVLRARPGASLTDVRLACSDLVSTTGDTIRSDNIEWRQVGYVWIDKPYNHPKVPDAAPGWWPDALLPVDAFDVPESFSQSVWVTVYAPAGTPPGVYGGEVHITSRGHEATTVPVRVRVHPFTLPVRGHLKTAFALMDGFLERPYGKPLSADVRQAYGDFVLKHRLNPDDISRTDPPAVEDLVHYRDRGLNAYNVINMVEERGERTWVCYSEPDTYTPEFKEQLIRRTEPAVERLRAESLLEWAYIYTFDERGLEYYPIMREYFGLVKQRWPEVSTFTTAQVPQHPIIMDLLNLDWICPLTAAYRFDEAERCRIAGKQIWAYVCLGPRYPYANFLADDPLIEARVIWWQAFHQRMDGFLYWGLNIWDRPGNDTPIDPSAGPLLDWSITTGGDYDWLHGDGRLIYAGVNGPIGSIRLANIRDGLEDYEYLWLLNTLSRNDSLARSVAEGVTRSLTDFTRDPEVLLRTRSRLADRIARALQRSRQPLH